MCSQNLFGTGTGKSVSAPRSRWLLASLYIGVALYLYVNLFVHSRIPILLSGDQLYFWMDGLRMLHGELPYRDFFQFTPPGTDVFYLSVFRLLGPHIWVTNMVVLVFGVALCSMCFSIATQIMEVQLALPATIFFLTLVYTKLLNTTHHWFSVMAILCAIRILLSERSGTRMIGAGACLGLACFFTQSHGVAGLLAFFVWLGWQYFFVDHSRRTLLAEAMSLLAGFAITLGVIESYFIATIGLKQLWYFQVTYVRKYRVHGAETDFLGMPSWSGWRTFPSASQYLLVYLLLPIAYTISLMRCWRLGSATISIEQYRRVMLVALTGTVLMCEVMFSLNWLRVYAISMPAIILSLWLIGQLRAIRRVLVGVVWIGILLVAALQTLHAHKRPYVIAKLPAGWAAVDPKGYQKLQWIEQHTRPEDFLFDAAWPGVYLPLQLRNPVFLDAVGPGLATRPEYVERTIAQLDSKAVRHILWSQQLDPSGDEALHSGALTTLRSYLHEKYTMVRVFDDGDEIWERR